MISHVATQNNKLVFVVLDGKTDIYRRWIENVIVDPTPKCKRVLLEIVWRM